MRTLNQEEKDLCSRILKGHGRNNFLGNLIDDKLNGVRIHIIKSLKQVTLLLQIREQLPTPDEQDQLIARIEQIRDYLITAINLLHMLDKEGYILLIQNATQVDDEKQFGRGVRNLPAISSSFADGKIAELLIDYTDKEIYVTEAFREFCANNYVANDQYRFSRQIRIAKYALIVAASALVLNTFFNALTKLSGGTAIKKEQIDTLSYRLKAIEDKLTDTLKVKVFPKPDPEIKKVRPTKQKNG